jgi:hypothetical protein
MARIQARSKRATSGPDLPAKWVYLPDFPVGVKLECITWEDHASSHDWTEFTTLEGLEPTLVVSVGWLQYEDKDIVVLVTNLRVDQPKCFGQTYIVKKAIHHRVPVKFDLTEKLVNRK